MGGRNIYRGIARTKSIHAEKKNIVYAEHRIYPRNVIVACILLGKLIN